MHRLLVESGLLNESSPALPTAELKHLKVLRPKDGEAVELFDGKGATRRYRFVTSPVESGRPLAATTERVFEDRSGPALTLFACVTKGSRWDWTIEKATELGVSRIVPVISDRTIVRLSREERPAKRERWQRIAEDAARQSDAKYLPEIVAAVDFDEALELVKTTTCFVGALVTPPAAPLAKAVAEAGEPRSDGWAVFVGPEGDFTPGELRALLQIAVPTSFGSSVLRAETAAIFALSVLQGIRDAH